MKIGRLTRMTATNAGHSFASNTGYPALRLMAVHSARGIMRQSVQMEMRRFRGRGNSTVLRAKFPPIRTNLGSKRTSVTQPPQPSHRRSVSYFLLALLQRTLLQVECTELIK